MIALNYKVFQINRIQEFTIEFCNVKNLSFLTQNHVKYHEKRPLNILSANANL